MQDAYWIREFVTFDQWPKNPMRRIGDAQLQAAPRVAMEISSWGEAVASCEAQRSVGCCFVGAIRLEKEPVRGYSFVVEHDVPAHSVLLIEKPLPLKCDVPLCYHPRTAKAVPASLYFFPLFLIPGHLLEKLPRFMRTLRARLNRFEALYGLGTVFNHSCRPNARRLTDADENVSIIAASRDIPAGEEVTLPYQDFGPSSSAWFRRLVLYYGFGFWCWCPCCTSDQKAYSEHASEDEIADIVLRARSLLCEEEDITETKLKVKAWKSWSFIFYSTLLLAGPPFVAGAALVATVPSLRVGKTIAVELSTFYVVLSVFLWKRKLATMVPACASQPLRSIYGQRHTPALLECAEDMLDSWQAEWDLAKKRPRPAPPGAERHGHGSIKGYFRGFRDIDEVRRLQSGKEDPGNAPPMRALPLAFIENNSLREKLSVMNANSTHPHARARAASFLVAEGARWLIVERGDQKEVIGRALSRLQNSGVSDRATEVHLQKIDELEDYHDWGGRFRKMPGHRHELLCGPQPCPPADGIGAGEDGSSKMHGLWSDAMRTAAVVLYLLKHHRGPLDILRASVDIGGDVDSIAALCLGVVGGSVGLDFGEPHGLPWFLLEEVEGVEYLHARGKKFEEWIGNQETA
ncbi:set5 [Symbiodinium microadriaticum]|nr:set5 [Symbiodinium microadriaticum]CAE7942015.1 set5 [Symbiodinium sp. KB8]